MRKIFSPNVIRYWMGFGMFFAFMAIGPPFYYNTKSPGARKAPKTLARHASAAMTRNLVQHVEPDHISCGFPPSVLFEGSG